MPALGCTQVLPGSHVLARGMLSVAGSANSSTNRTQSTKEPHQASSSTAKVLCASAMCCCWRCGIWEHQQWRQEGKHLVFPSHLERLSCIPPVKHIQPSCEASRRTEQYKNSPFCSALSSNMRLPYKNKYTKRNDHGVFSAIKATHVLTSLQRGNRIHPFDSQLCAPSVFPPPTS